MMTPFERLCFVVLYGAGLGAFASATDTPFVWVLLVPAALSFVWRLEHVPASIRPWPRRVLWLALALTVLLGWIVMAYPILSDSAIRVLSLVTGYPLTALGAVFLLGSKEWPWPRSFLPAALSVLVIAGFNNLAPIHPYLVTAGGAGFACLARASLGERVSWKRGLSLAAGLGFVLAVAVAIVRSLPWAQGRVEETMVQLYTTRSSGFSGQSSGGMLGELESLKLSQRVVLRLWSQEPRKLRGRVSTQFDGRRWYGRSEQRLVSSESSPGETAPPGWDDLPGRDFLVSSGHAIGSNGALRTATIVRSDNGTGAILAPTGALLLRAAVDRVLTDAAGVLSLPPLASVRIYGVLYDGLNDPREIPDAYLEECSGVPEDTDRRLVELAGRLAEDADTPEERLRRTVDYVASACRYSLDVGKFQSDQPVAEFLFEKRRGYCEYFASAAAVLLRLQNVPTRYVGGFNVIESNRSGDHFVVRESDAHAWIESYIPGRGWVEADPTPAAEYESLHSGLSTGWLAETLERITAAASELRVRLGVGDWKWLARVSRSPFLLAPLLVFLGARVFRYARRWFRWRRRPKAKVAHGPPAVPPELVDWMARLDREWKRRNLSRPPSRAPLEHLSALPADAIPTPFRDTGLRVIECYYRAVFRGDPTSADDLAALGRAMKELDRQGSSRFSTLRSGTRVK